MIAVVCMLLGGFAAAIGPALQHDQDLPIQVTGKTRK